MISAFINGAVVELSDEEYAKRFPASPAEPEPVPDFVSETQFMRASTRIGLVTGQEAEDYLARGVIPAFVASALDKIEDEAERTDARLKVIGSDQFRRADAIFALLIASKVATAEEVDGLFRLADTLN